MINDIHGPNAFALSVPAFALLDEHSDFTEPYECHFFDTWQYSYLKYVVSWTSTN